MQNRQLKKNRYSFKVQGDKITPRLAVFRSDKFIYAQIIDDVSAKTLASASDIKKDSKLNKMASSVIIGKMIAEKAKELNIKKVKFDRGGYLYHGRVKALAESARENGLEF
jgi:large subunit ribosomal protein L18